jgi:hypothetical protein
MLTIYNPYEYIYLNLKGLFNLKNEESGFVTEKNRVILLNIF